MWTRGHILFHVLRIGVQCNVVHQLCMLQGSCINVPETLRKKKAEKPVGAVFLDETIGLLPQMFWEGALHFCQPTVPS